MPKYKEMYEWEKASHFATEEELQRFKRMYAELTQTTLTELGEKRKFIDWLQEYARDLELLKNIHLLSPEKKLLYKILGQMEFIVEILDYFNNKKEDVNVESD